MAGEQFHPRNHQIVRQVIQNDGKPCWLWTRVGARRRALADSQLLDYD